MYLEQGTCSSSVSCYNYFTTLQTFDPGVPTIVLKYQSDDFSMEAKILNIFLSVSFTILLIVFGNFCSVCQLTRQPVFFCFFFFFFVFYQIQYLNTKIYQRPGLAWLVDGYYSFYKMIIAYMKHFTVDSIKTEIST